VAKKVNEVDNKEATKKQNTAQEKCAFCGALVKRIEVEIEMAHETLRGTIAKCPECGAIN